MRVTVDPTDKSFDPEFDLSQYEIYFNGVKINDCITADDEINMVLRYVYEGLLDTEWFDGEVKIVVNRVM